MDGVSQVRLKDGNTVWMGDRTGRSCLSREPTRALYPEGDSEVLEGWKGLRLDQGPTVKAKGAGRPTD